MNKNLIAMASKTITYKKNKEWARGVRRDNETCHKGRINKGSLEVWEKAISRLSRRGVRG